MRYMIFVVLLSGCSNLVASTAARLADLSPLEADPGGFAIRADLPEGLDLVPGASELTLSATRDDGMSASGTFAILKMDGDEPLWRIDPARLDDLRTLQTRIRSWEEADPDGTTGSLGITVKGCRIGAGPAPDATLSLWIRITADTPLRPLLRNLPVAKIQDDGARQLPPCP